MNNKSVALCAAAVLIASVQWAPAYATPMACTDPEPAGTLDCGVFLGPGNMGTLGPGGNPLKTLYWNDDTANPLFGNTSFTEYSQVAKWDFEAGWEDENGLLAGIVSILGSDEDGEPRWGTWELPFAVDLMVIKGATNHALYFVDGVLSGDWSAYGGLPKNRGGKVPAVSNITWYGSREVSVPEPGTLLLLGAGLAGLGFSRRFRRSQSR